MGDTQDGGGGGGGLLVSVSNSVVELAVSLGHALLFFSLAGVSDQMYFAGFSQDAAQTESQPPGARITPSHAW